MLKKHIKYKDLDGNPVERDFNFHLFKSDLAEMLLVNGDDYEDRVKELVAAKDAQSLINLFKDLIGKSYGVRDGEQFKRSPEITASFMQSDAYSELFLELMSSSTSAAEFFRGVMPADVSEKVQLGEHVSDIQQSEEHPSEPPPPPAPAPHAHILPVDPPVETDDNGEPARGSIDYYDKMLQDESWSPSRWDLQRMSNEQMQTAFARRL